MGSCFKACCSRYPGSRYITFNALQLRTRSGWDCLEGRKKCKEIYCRPNCRSWYEFPSPLIRSDTNNIGCFVDSCRKCPECSVDDIQYCSGKREGGFPGLVNTYGSPLLDVEKHTKGFLHHRALFLTLLRGLFSRNCRDSRFCLEYSSRT